MEMLEPDKPPERLPRTIHGLCTSFCRVEVCDFLGKHKIVYLSLKRDAQLMRFRAFPFERKCPKTYLLDPYRIVVWVSV